MSAAGAALLVLTAFDAQAAHVVSGDAKVFSPTPPFDPLSIAEIGINGLGSWSADGVGFTNASTLIGTSVGGGGSVLFTNHALIHSTDSLRVGVRGAGLLRVTDGSVLNVGSVPVLANGSYPLNVTVGSPATGRAIISGDGTQFNIIGALGIGSSSVPGGLSNGIVTVHGGAKLSATAIAISSLSGTAALYLGTDDPLYPGDEAPVGPELSTVTGSEVVYVGFSDRGRLEMADRTRLNGGNLQVGYLFGGNGVLTAHGAQALIDMTKFVSIGQAGRGSVELYDHATLRTENAAGLFLGAGGGYGTLTLRESASANVGFMGAGGYGFVDFDVIGGGYGQVTLTGGAQLDTQGAHLGYLLDGVGDVAVGDFDAAQGPSVWRNVGEVIVGKVGTGALTIYSTGHVTTDTLRVGDELDSTGDVALVAAQSADEGGARLLTHQLEIGRRGKAVLSVGAYGRVNADDIVIAAGAGVGRPERARIEVKGAMATVIASGGLTVGRGVNNAAELRVNDHGAVRADTIVVGELAGALGEIHVEDHGSLSAALIDVGRGGSGLLDVTDARVTVNRLLVGTGANALGEVRLHGAQTNLEVGSQAIVGGGAFGDLLAPTPYAGGTLRLSEGAQFIAAELSIGDATTGIGNVLVDDQDSFLSVSGTLRVGRQGRGFLQVGHAGEVWAGTLVAGDDTTSLDNEITVAGDARITANDSMSIGRHGTARLSIDGGIVEAGVSVFGENVGGLGELEMSGTQGVAFFGANALVLAQAGTASAVLDAGTLSTYSLRMASAASGSGALSVYDDALVYVAGALTVGERGVAGAYFFDSSSLDTIDTDIGLEAGSSGRLELGPYASAFASGAEWDNHGALQVGRRGTGELLFNAARLHAESVLVGVDVGGDGTFLAKADFNSSIDIAALTVGDAGRGTFKVSGPSGSVDLGNVVIGAAASGRGTVDIAATVETNTVTVGRAGGGELDVHGAAADLHTTTAVLGTEAQAVGTAALFDRAHWQIAQDLVIGQAGAGDVDVRDFARLEIGRALLLGGNASAAGRLRVRDGGYAYITEESVVGDHGRLGSVQVLNGGELRFAAPLSVGRSQGGYGELIAAGVGSLLALGDRVALGEEGDAGMFVQDGAFAEGYIINVGASTREASDATAQLYVHDHGHVNLSYQLVLGGTGTNYFTLDSGGALSAAEVTIGAADGSLDADTRDFADVGADSSLTVGGRLWIGAGARSQLLVHDGGTVEAGSLDIGDTSFDHLQHSSGTVQIDGAGSSLTVHGDAALDSTVGGSRLEVTHGATATFDGGLRAGLGFEFGTRADVVVDGAGSRLTIAGANGFLVGSSGPAVVVVRHGGELAASHTVVFGASTLTGDGATISGDVLIDGGTLAPGNSPGHMNFTDTLRLHGSFAAEIGGLLRGAEYDAIDANVVELGGLLVVDLYDFDLDDFGAGDYVPQEGDSFDLIRAHDISGDFIDLIFNGPLGAYAWDHAVIDLGDGLYAYQISVARGAPVPLPSAVWLFASAAVFVRRRRCGADLQKFSKR